MKIIPIIKLIISMIWLAMGLVIFLDPSIPELLWVDIVSKPIFIGTLAIFIVWSVYDFWRMRQGHKEDRFDIIPRYLAMIAIGFMLLSLDAPSFKGKSATDQGRPFTIIFANLWVQNPHPETLYDWIDDKAPDLVALAEGTPLSLKTLTPKLKDKYPYATRDRYMQIFSKYPIQKTYEKPTALALMQVELVTKCGPIPISVIHLTRPWPFTERGAQQRQFDRLSDLIKAKEWDQNPRHIIMGDFNHPLHTGPFKRLLADLNLRTHKGNEGTWPIFAPSLLRIRIDQILAGKAWTPSHRELGPDYGSDHLPVYSEFMSADRDCANAGSSKALATQH